MSNGETEWKQDPFVKVGRRSRWQYVLVVLAILVAALVLWTNLDDDRPSATAGHAITAADPIPVAKHWTVLVPGTQLDVGATSLLDDVPNDLAASKVQAPDGGAFVGVRVREVSVDPFQISQHLDAVTYGDHYGATPAMTVNVQVDGRTYSLDPDSDTSGEAVDLPTAVYLPVAGHPSSIRLVVSFGGRSQSIDLLSGHRQKGDFAALYDKHPALASCGRLQTTTGYRAQYEPAICHYAATRYPYVKGEGWAPKGKVWLVVEVGTQAPLGLVREKDGRGYYLDSFPSVEPLSRLDGRKPVDDGGLEGFSPTGRTYVLLWAVSARQTSPHVLTAVQRDEARVRVDKPGAPYEVIVFDTWKVRIP